MSILHSPAFRRYALGLGAVVAGAGVTDATGSMLPLAMGSAVALMTTFGFVRAIRARAVARRAPPRR